MSEYSSPRARFTRSEVEAMNDAVVTDLNGVRGRIRANRFDNDRAIVLINFDGEREVWLPAELLIAQEDGTYHLPRSVSELERLSTGIAEIDETAVIPVVEEELQVGKRAVETGKVRVSTVVHEREEVADVPLFREEVEVKRVQVNRVVDKPASVRHEGDTMIVPLHKEVLFVQKRLAVTEELHITKKRTEKTEQVSATLRSEEAVVDRVDAQDQPDFGKRENI